MSHTSDFTQSQDKVLLDLINYDNQTTLTLEQVQVGDVTEGTDGRVNVVLNAKEGSGFVGSETVSYVRLDIQDFFDVYFPGGFTLQQGDATKLSDFLPEINTALGTNIDFLSIVDVDLVWVGSPNEVLPVIFEILGTSKVYSGAALLSIDGNEIPLESIVTLQVLSGLNMPVTGPVDPVDPPPPVEDPKTFTRYVADFTQLWNGTQVPQIIYDGGESVLPDVSFRFNGGQWYDRTVFTIDDFFASFVLPEQYRGTVGTLDIRNNGSLESEWELRVNIALTELVHFQENREPVTNFSKRQLVQVPSELPASVTDLSGMFEGAIAFNNTNIIGWDTSGVTKMNGTFYGNTAFNQDISGWDVSNVTDMEDMLSDAVVFNQDLSSWNIINVTNHDGYDRNTPAWVLPRPPFVIPKIQLSSLFDTTVLNGF